MTPYFERDGVTIYHGDCREVLPVLGLVDLVVTDPPYRSLDIDVIRGTTTRLVGGKNRRAGNRIDSAGPWFATLNDDELVASLELARGRLDDDGAMYVFADVKTGLAVFPRLAPSNVLVWDKERIGMGYSWRRCHEWIAYCPQPAHRLRSAALGDIIRASAGRDKQHPTEKPRAVIAPLLRNSTDPGGLVLDPFMGSGTTLRAALDLGRRAIGIEIEERYCEIAARRLDQMVLPLAVPS